LPVALAGVRRKADCREMKMAPKPCWDEEKSKTLLLRVTQAKTSETETDEGNLKMESA